MRHYVLRSIFVLIMGANLSISQRLRVVLRTPLSQYRNGEWVLICACRNCAAEAEIPVVRLLEAHGRRTVAETIERRCSRCRQPPAAIVLQSKPSTYEGRVEVVRLRGSGAYA